MQSGGRSQQPGPCHCDSASFLHSDQHRKTTPSVCCRPTAIFTSFIELIGRNRSSRLVSHIIKFLVPLILLFSREQLVNMVKLLYGRSFCAIKTFNKTRIEIWNLFHFNCWKNKKSEFILLNLAILTLVSSQWLPFDIETLVGWNGRYGWEIMG